MKNTRTGIHRRGDNQDSTIGLRRLEIILRQATLLQSAIWYMYILFRNKCIELKTESRGIIMQSHKILVIVKSKYGKEIQILLPII